MGRKLGGIALLVVPALMLFGFAWSGAHLTPVSLFGVLLVVVLPAIDGVAALRASLRRNSDTRLAQLRRETFDAEILRVATERHGHLTALDVASILGLPADESKAALDDLVQRQVASLQVSDEGVPVYKFPSPISAFSTTCAARPPAR